MRRAVPALAAALAAATLVAAPARAAEPIMPLGQVQKGMRCTALSVLQGTEISSFDAEVVDVVGGDPAAEAPRILVRLGGERIERTGVGPGFSGSPISCPDGQGVQRVIGAISESIGEFGGTLVLATPIEAILGQPVEPPGPTSPTPAGARALRTPLTLAGLSPDVGALFSRAARRGRRTLLTTPARPRAAAFPPQVLRPGSAMAAGLSSGDLSAGAVGTVSYVDGDAVWAFGHPLDGAGRRSLLLQDAYVYAVVNNPLGIEGASTYKLAAPGNDLGILSGDGRSAVAGRTGAPAPSFPLRVNARDADTGRRRVLNVRIADETALALPTGTSALSLVGGAAVAQAAATILGASPARQTGELCARIEVRESRRPLRFCNRYVTRSTAEGEDEVDLGAGSAMVTDFVEAVTAVDEFNFGELHITGVDVNIELRRGLRQAFLLEGRAPGVVRRGRTARVRVKVQEVRGRARWRTIRVRVPADTPRGERELLLEGTPADSSSGLELDLGELLFGAEGEEPEGAPVDDEAGPRTVPALRRVVAGLSRFDGVRASFPRPEDDTPPIGRRILRDPELRLSGTLQIPVRIR